MKTTLDLPDDLVREMKLRAVIQGRTLRDLAADLLRQGLGLAAPRPPAATPQNLPFEQGADGIPIFRKNSSAIANAPAAQMSLAELLKLEQDALGSEDMQRAGIAI